MERVPLVVIGAGAAGTWCAWRAAELGVAGVTLIEKTPRVGTKILASGGSRCNLTTTLDGHGAAALFGPKGARFLRRAFGVLAPLDVRARFGELGVATEVAPLEKIFPASGSAREVRDALESAARAAGVAIELDAGVIGIEPLAGGELMQADAAQATSLRAAKAQASMRVEAAGAECASVDSASGSASASTPGETRPANADAAQAAGHAPAGSHGKRRKRKAKAPRGPAPDAGGWRIARTDGSAFIADQVVLATGGQSYASTGTTGDAYAWLRALGLELVEPRPALVPLLSPAEWVHDLKGIALQHVNVRLLDAKGKQLAERRRPLLFTHQGLSGPAAMDLSRIPARTGDAYMLRVDLVPDTDREELRAALIELAGRPRAPQVLTLIQELLSARAGEVVPKRLIEALLAGLDIDPRGTMQRIDKPTRHALIETIKGWDLPVRGDAGYAKAEVTSGGLALHAVDPGTCAVRGFERLYVIGELLDLDGPIGGLNFQSAFATAELAARALAQAT